MSFVHLHTHSEFSLLSGTAKIPQLVQKTKELGMQALALTDTNRMSGLILFYKACQAAGIKPILGVELTDPKNEARTVVLLAKNRGGYGDLCELVTRRQINPPDDFFAAMFAKHFPDLFLLTSHPDVLRELCATSNKVNVYGELINHDTASRRQSRQLEKAARGLGVPCVVTGNVTLLTRADWPLHKILRAIDLNASLSFLNKQDYCPGSAWLRPAKEMHRLFPDHGQALSTTAMIAGRCNVHFDFGNWIMPRISVPGGFTPDTYLAELAGRGLDKHYGGTGSYARAQKIQQMELEVIHKLGYSSYFLMVKEVRDWAGKHFASHYRRPKDCSILRGSAANSITFYNLEASDLDPIKYNLYFQRFLNEDRASPPDADLDFGWDEREDVLEYVSHRFGTDRVAITCTFNHFRGRGSFREVAKVYGYTEEEITNIIDSHKTRTKRIVDDDILELWKVAEQIKGRPRFLGQHPGGVLITNDPICRHVGLEKSGGEKNRTITQIDMHSGIDELGLIKFDLLGNGSLSVLRDALGQLQGQGIADPDVWDLEKCCTDYKVQEIITHGRTRGIFYIESPAQTRLNKKSQARTFEEITITSSLIRPAGAAYTQTFIERHRKMKMGICDWKFLHPSLEPILKDTHDVFAFQEDVTRACHQVAGMSYKKSDRIRKMMNSMHDGELTDDEWSRTEAEFIQGCMLTSGLTKGQARELWKRVSSFTGFSFCKSHSASYAQLSFKCTYLKGHYPAQFLSSVISNEHGYYSKHIYLDEARRWGVRILPININESHIKYHGKEGWIRPGFMHIRNLSGAAMESIVQQRESGGRFTGLMDFLKRVRIGKKECESLILVGAFEGMGGTQPQLLYQLEGMFAGRLLKPVIPAQAGIQSSPGSTVETQGELFDTGLDAKSVNKGSLDSRLRGNDGSWAHARSFSDYTLMEKCLNELHLLGYMLSGNFLDILEMHPSAKNTVPAARIHKYVGQRIKVFGSPVTERLHHVSATGKLMEFLTLEDKTEHMDIIFWPEVFKRFRDDLAALGPCEVYGKVTNDWGTYCIEADFIRPVEWSPNLVDFELASAKLSKSVNQYRRYEDIRQLQEMA